MLQIPYSLVGVIVAGIVSIVGVYVTLSDRLRHIETRQAAIAFMTEGNCDRMRAILATTQKQIEMPACPRISDIVPGE